MGLDMYAYAAKVEVVGDQQVDIVLPDGTYRDLAYWRKFNALHGWMERLYREKGGTSPDFNIDTVRLMPEDLDKLEQELNELKPTAGFFFGKQSYTEEDKQKVKEFIQKARAAIEEGNVVIYESWW